MIKFPEAVCAAVSGAAIDASKLLLAGKLKTSQEMDQFVLNAAFAAMKEIGMIREAEGWDGGGGKWMAEEVDEEQGRLENFPAFIVKIPETSH